MDSLSLPPMPLQDSDRLISFIARLALSVAATVALAIPLGFSVHEYTDLISRTDRQALTKAGAITGLISGNPDLWTYQIQRMEEPLANYPVPTDDDRATVYDARGMRLLSVGDPPAWPVLKRSRPLYDSGRVVGKVEVERSLRAFLYQIALTALLGLLLGGAVYGVVLTLPRRALRRMGLALDAEHATLRSSEERYRTVADFTYDWEYWRGPDGSLRYVSPSCLRVTGYRAGEFQQDPGLLLQIVHPDDRAELDRHLHTVEKPEANTDHYELDFRILTRDGEERWIAHVCQPISDQDGKYLGRRACNRDITKRKRAEAAKAQLEAQLRESQKMEALGTLAGGVAHDFNNIIAAILGNLELVRQDVGPAHAALEGLEEIRKASRRAMDLVRQILAFGRRQGLSRKAISLAPVVEESARLLRPTLLEGITLNIECATDAPTVLADTTQIQQVLLNLCGNAWQAMRGQGRPGVIKVRLEAHRVDEAPYQNPEGRSAGERIGLRPGRYACLTVSDNGPGMDEATRSRMFEPFFTTKPVGEGTGLGLAVVHGIVQAHEACIVVDSEPGKGTTFRIYFPAVNAPVPALAGQEPPAPRKSDGDALVLHGEGKHILYVDDDDAIVFLMRRLLERRGFRVSGYTDAYAAVAAVRANPGQFDLAVTDHNMPGMSGLDVARTLREIRGDLPVVVASGYVSEELRIQAPAAGVRELLFKPNTVEDFCGMVAQLANGAGPIVTGQTKA